MKLTEKVGLFVACDRSSTAPLVDTLRTSEENHVNNELNELCLYFRQYEMNCEWIFEGNIRILYGSGK